MRKIKQINSVGALNFLDFFRADGFSCFNVVCFFIHSFIHVSLEFWVAFFFEVLGEIGMCLCLSCGSGKKKKNLTLYFLCLTNYYY